MKKISHGLLIVGFSFFLAARITAIENGGAAIGYEYRNQGSQPKQFENIFHFDLWQNLGNNGTISFLMDWVNGNPFAATNKVGRLSLTLSGYKLRKAYLEVIAGDSELLFTSLSERFANSTYPGIYLRGLQTSLISRAAKITLFGGNVAWLSGLLGKTVDITDQSLIGVTGKFRLAAPVLLGTGLVLTRNENTGSPETAGNSNALVLIDTEISLAQWLKWLGEYKHSEYRQEGGSKTKNYALKLGPTLKTKNIKLEFNYYYSGDTFHFVNEASQPGRDLKGLFLLTQVGLWNRLNLFGNFDISRNNTSDRQDIDTVEYQRRMLGFSFFSPGAPSFYFFHNQNGQKNLNRAAEPTATDSTSVFSEIRYPFHNTDPYIRFRRFAFNRQADQPSGYIQNIWTIGLRQIFRHKFQSYIEAELDRREEIDGRMTNIQSARLGFNYFAGRNWSCWGETAVAVRESWEPSSQKPALSATLGLTCQLPWGIRFFTDIRYDRLERLDAFEYDLPFLHGFQVTLRISKQFNWGRTGPSRSLGMAGGMEAAGYGSVEGVVFNDRNQNGIQDAGEEGIKNVAVIGLEDGSAVSSDGNGRYRLARVATGAHLLTFNGRKIPARYTIISPEKVRIEVRLRENVKVDFQVIETGRIAGQIILDANGNGQIDPGEKGLPDALIFLQPGDLNTYSAENGMFLFDNILPGESVLTLDAASLPEGAVPTSPAEQKLPVAVGQSIADIFFLVHIKPRPVNIKKFENKENKNLKKNH